MASTPYGCYQAFLYSIVQKYIHTYIEIIVFTVNHKDQNLTTTILCSQTPLTFQKYFRLSKRISSLNIRFRVSLAYLENISSTPNQSSRDFSYLTFSQSCSVIKNIVHNVIMINWLYQLKNWVKIGEKVLKQEKWDLRPKSRTKPLKMTLMIQSHSQIFGLKQTLKDREIAQQ